MKIGKKNYENEIVTLQEFLSNKGELPEGWHWSELGMVCDFLDSQRIPINEFEREKRIKNKEKSELYPYYGATGLAGYIDGFLFDEPLILLAEDGADFGSTTSHVAYDVSGKCWVNNHAHVLRPKANIDFNYCLFCLIIRPDLKPIVTQSTRAKLNQKMARTIPIPLPPKPEQERIAEILKERLKKIKDIKQNLENQLITAKNLPKSYFREIFEKNNYQWDIVKLGKIALKVQNGLYKPPEYYGSGQPFIRMYNILNDSWILDLTNLAQINVDNNELEKYSLEKNDLLINRVNSYELVGKCAIFNCDSSGYIFENMLIRIRLKPSINPLFIVQQMWTKNVQDQIKIAAKRAIGQSSINSDDIKNIELKIPKNEKDQDHIADYLNRKIIESLNLQSSLENQLKITENLQLSLLKQAFRGEL